MLGFFTESSHREIHSHFFTNAPMLHSHPTATLGADLRSLRKSRGVTLTDLAMRLDRSVGWLSQVERDLSEPSITDLRRIAKHLDVPISLLFGQATAPADEVGYVVRQGARRAIGSSETGLIEELLSPDLTDDFEVVHSTFKPHSQIGEAVTRPTQEVAYLLSGKLDVEIGDRIFTIHPGDSFRIRGEAHRWINPYDEPAVAIWVIAPPVY
ncbi:MAG: transcriptional regulator with XRE-family HTH domain [Paracoccaceae bacterium]|jgi:transcriptional regulator with XRE-family HTH domain